jgi:hypothetical protein
MQIGYYLLRSLRQFACKEKDAFCVQFSDLCEAQFEEQMLDTENLHLLNFFYNMQKRRQRIRPSQNM